MKDKLSETQITGRITKLEADPAAGNVVVSSGFDQDEVANFLRDQYLRGGDIESVTLAELEAVKTSLYHDILPYKDKTAYAQASIKWTGYAATAVMTLLAALNLSSTNSSTTQLGGKLGATIYSATQIVVAIVAVGIVKYVCEPIIETSNDAIVRLKAVRTYTDTQIELRKNHPPVSSVPQASCTMTPSTTSTFSPIQPAPVGNSIPVVR